MSVNIVEQLQSKVEVWRNTSRGMRWYIAFDLQGRETTKTVPGNRTFTITTFERQINQERAADPEQDLFRNGTFVLQKPSTETNEKEIESPDSLTDHEVDEMVREIVHGDLRVSDAIADITSLVTLTRIYEVLMAEDATKRTIDTVKRRIKELNPAAATERETVPQA